MSTRFLALGLKLLVSVALVAWLVARLDAGPVLAEMLAIRLVDIVLVFALIALQSLLFAVRWRLVSKGFAAALPFAETLRIVLVSMFFSQTLPGAIGGDAARIVLGRREAIPLKATVTAVLADRLIGMLVLVAMVAAALPAAARLMGDARASAALAAVALAVVATCVLLLLFGKRLLAPLAGYAVFRNTGEFFAAVREVLTTGPRVLPILLASIAIHLLSVAVAFAIARSIHVQVPVGTFLALMLPVLFVMMIPISIAGWGVREGAMVVALGYASVAQAQALGISLAFGATFVLAGLPGALIWVADSLRRSGPGAAHSRAAGKQSH